MPRQIDRLLDEFYEYWKRNVDRGRFSGLSGVERCSIEMCLRWLLRNYKVTKKEVKGAGK